jgi:hypothetical protein
LPAKQRVVRLFALSHPPFIDPPPDEDLDADYDPALYVGYEAGPDDPELEERDGLDRRLT